jgi:hypothetical protein
LRWKPSQIVVINTSESETGLKVEKERVRVFMEGEGLRRGRVERKEDEAEGLRGSNISRGDLRGDFFKALLPLLLFAVVLFSRGDFAVREQAFSSFIVAEFEEEDEEDEEEEDDDDEEEVLLLFPILEPRAE